MNKWLTLALIAVLTVLVIVCSVQVDLTGQRIADLEARLEGMEGTMGAELDGLRAEVDEMSELVDTLHDKLHNEDTLANNQGSGEPLPVAVVGGEELMNTIPMSMYYQYESLYAMYGITDSESLTQLKQDIVNDYVMNMVALQKADQLGLSELSDEELSDIKQRAAELYEEEIEYYLEYYLTEDNTEEEARALLLADLESEGYSVESQEQELIDELKNTRLREHVSESVTVSDEDIRAYYDELVEYDTGYYEDVANFEYDMLDGYKAVYHPEGFRTVKHILVSLSDDQSTRLTDLTNELNDINIAIEAETATDDQVARKPELESEIQAIYEEVQPTLDEIYLAIESGADFDELIEKYGSDPGMAEEPGKSAGYYVHADSSIWERGFTDAAMALEKIGDVSEPVWLNNGVHIIKYISDVTPGVIPYEEIKDSLTADVLADKQETAYSEALAQWAEEIGVTYYYENMK